MAGEPSDRSPGSVARLLPWVLTVCGALGLLASLDLTYERILLLLDPTYVPTCSLNPVLDCGVVASSPQATAFGSFPNTLVGVVAFSVVLTVGVLALLGARLPRAALAGLTVGGLLGTVFVHWLIWSSVFVIGVLCPYCVVVWAVTVPVLWYSALACASEGLLGRRVVDSGWLRTLLGVHVVPVLLWYAAVATLVGVVFADSWALLLGG